MVVIDLQHREVTIKLVYYGPALSGKTTNLQTLHRLLGHQTGSELLSLETKDDRTLFFDLLPLRFDTASGLQINVKMFTVPGQVFHDGTRRIVLQGADGVAFIADSRISETRGNNESFANLRKNLHDNGIAWDDMPVVIQFNKRDLPGIRPDEAVDRIAAKGREPIFKATAISGQGVVETFLGLCDIAWVRLEQKYLLGERFGVTHAVFMERIQAAFPSVVRPPGSGT